MKKILENEKTVLAAGGRSGFELNDRDCFYYVSEGNLDIFAVTLNDDMSYGARNSIMHLEQGRIFFGFPKDVLQKHGLALFVNGTIDAKVVKIPVAKLKKLANNASHIASVASAIDGWIENASRALSDCGSAPRNSRDISVKKNQAFEAGELIFPRKGTLWVSVEKGNVHFNGIESLPLKKEDGLFPATYLSCMNCAENSVLHASTTRDALQKGSFWQDFARYQGLLVRLIQYSIQQDLAREYERILQRTENQRNSINTALDSFRRLVNGETAVEESPETGDPMLVVCREIAEHLKIDISTPAHPEHEHQGSSLESIVRASRIRSRRVALKGAWWSMDSGPMVGYIMEDKRPVALLQRAPGKYEMFDPLHNERIQVTEEVAEKLDYFADMLYRTFPSKKLNGWDLVKFGIAGRMRDMVVILIMGILGGLLGMLTPVITGIIFDEVIPGVQLNQLFMLAMALIVAGIATASFEFTRRIAFMRMEGRIDQHAQGAVIDRLIELPAAFFRKYSAGDLADRAMGIHSMRQILSGTTINAIISGVFSTFNLVLLFYYSSKLAMWALLITAVIISIIVVSNRFQIKYQKQMAEMSGTLSGRVLEFIMAISKFRVSGTEGRAFALWADAFGGMRAVSRTSRVVANAVDTYVTMIPIVTSMIIFTLIVSMSESEPMSIGAFLAFNAAFSQFLSACIQIMESMESVLGAVPQYQRSLPILETLPESDEAKTDPGVLTGRLEMNQVSFSYDSEGPLVLDNVTIVANHGEFIALVGPSGSGKSTIARLLLGFEKPDSGSIFYDQQDIAGLDLRMVRRQMGVVLQNGQVMSGDIMTNIIGSALLTVDDAWDAARMCGLDDDIRSMPMGMHTVLSEGGSTLSGGQKQRLMIARALVRKPKILIFDEATSALDNATQAIVNKSLEHLNTTRIVIAHRLSTIVNADRIYVIEKGRVVQSGRYEELMKVRGVFSDIATRQLS